MYFLIVRICEACSKLSLSFPGMPVWISGIRVLFIFFSSVPHLILFFFLFSFFLNSDACFLQGSYKTFVNALSSIDTYLQLQIGA